MKTKEKIINKYASGKKLTRSEASILGHLHTKSFGKKIKGKYVLFPRDHSKNVKVINKRPNPDVESKRGYGFAEGSFKTNKEVCNRIGQLHGKMNKKWKNKCSKYYKND